MRPGIEVGVIVDIKAGHQQAVSRVLTNLRPGAQMCVLQVIPKGLGDRSARVQVATKPGDEEGHWLWKVQLHRVASKKIAAPWKDVAA